MKLVIDSNILFSALLSRNNLSKRILFDKSFDIYTCNYLFIEIFKHKERLLKISRLTEEDLMLQFENVLSRVKFVNEGLITTDFFYKAFMLCKDVDEKDTPFVALSMFLQSALLTGDIKLFDHLKNEGFNVVKLTQLF